MAGDLLGRLNAVSMENVLFKENPGDGFRNDSAGEGFDNENAGDGFAEAKYFSNSSSSTLISSNFCAKVLLGALRE
jgi:hypothetical protein